MSVVENKKGVNLMTIPHYTGFFNHKSSISFENQTFEGEVLHVFNQTINIVLKKQFPNLLTIGGMQILGNPQSLAFSNFHVIQSQLKVGDRCLLQGTEQLIFSDFQCHLKLIAEDEGERTLSIIPRPSFLEKIQLLKLALLGKNTSQTHPSFAPFYQQLYRESEQLNTALLKGDREVVQEKVRRMIGLGIGLTPSGDDFLTGMLLVLQNEKELGHFLQQSVLQELTGTNVISQHQLYFACQGVAKPSLLVVVQGIFDETSELAKLQQAITETLAIGSTSGHDLLSGVVQGFDLLNRKGEEKNEFSRKSNSKSLH